MTFVFIISILFGAISFSVVLYAVQQSEFNVWKHLGHSGIEAVLGIIPVIWIVFLVVFFITHEHNIAISIILFNDFLGTLYFMIGVILFFS